LVLLFGHFLLGLTKDGAFPCPMICISLIVHAIHMYVLALTLAPPSVRVAVSRVVIISFRFESPILVFWLRRSKIFLPVL
jgi:hypothetical protein